MVFNNVSVWLVSDAACCAKGQSGDGVGRLRARWHMLSIVEVALQEKRNAVHLNQGSAIRGSFSPHMYSSWLCAGFKAHHRLSTPVHRLVFAAEKLRDISGKDLTYS
jgi:hypothetical protein